MARLSHGRVGGPRATSRRGFTLLEILLAMTIGVALLAALYVAMNTQIRQTEQAREIVQESELAQNIFSRISRETAACVPATYNMTNMQNNWPGGGGAGGGGGGGSGSSGGASSASTGSSSTSGASTSGSGSSSSSGGSSSGMYGNYVSNASSGTTPLDQTSSVDTSPYQIPFATGLQGDNQHLILYVSVWPREVFDANLAGAAVPEMSDQRRITYWLASTGGLARQEVDQVTSDQQMQNVPPSVPDEAADVFAKEVRSVSFRYFDGTQWDESWDGSQPGPDGVTPMGPPVAVEITLTIVPSGKPADQAHERTYRRVVAIVTAPNPAIQVPPTTTVSTVTGSTSTGTTSSSTSP